MDCLDCKHCKVIVSKMILRCKKNHWVKNDESEKVIKLREMEGKTLRIEWRNTFAQGEKCADMISMID